MCALSYRYGFEDDLTADRAALARGGDWDVPLFCRDDCYDTSAEARHVFPQNTFFIVGGARTGTNLHVDPNCTSAWNALCAGASAGRCSRLSMPRAAQRWASSMTPLG